MGSENIRQIIGRHLRLHEILIIGRRRKLHRNVIRIGFIIGVYNFLQYGKLFICFAGQKLQFDLPLSSFVPAGPPVSVSPEGFELQPGTASIAVRTRHKITCKPFLLIDVFSLLLQIEVRCFYNEIILCIFTVFQFK